MIACRDVKDICRRAVRGDNAAIAGGEHGRLWVDVDQRLDGSQIVVGPAQPFEDHECAQEMAFEIVIAQVVGGFGQVVMVRQVGERALDMVGPERHQLVVAAGLERRLVDLVDKRCWKLPRPNGRVWRA